jgi:HEPN domain-containing protein
MGRLKNEILVPDSSMSLYTENGFRYGIGTVISLIPGAFGFAATFAGGPLAVGLPGLALFALIWAWIIFAPHIPKLHYLYGLSGYSYDAIKWYEELASDEKKQLPKDWDDVVRKHGNMTVPHDDDHIYKRSVAFEMLQAAKKVVELYNEAQEVDNTPVLDYRVDVHLQLMSERAEQLQQEITDRTEIQDKIKEMP